MHAFLGKVPPRARRRLWELQCLVVDGHMEDDLDTQRRMGFRRWKEPARVRSLTGLQPHQHISTVSMCCRLQMHVR